MDSVNGSPKIKAINKAAALTRRAMLIFDQSRKEERAAMCRDAMNLLKDFLVSGDNHKLDPDIAFHIINAKCVMGHPKQAREYAQILADQNQNDVILKILSTIEYNAGLIEFDAGALWSVMQKTSRDDFATAMMRIGNQYHDVGEYSQAKTVYNTLLPFDHGNPDLLFRIAQVDLFMGRYDAADDIALNAKALCGGEEPMATAINRLLHEIHLNIVKYDQDHIDRSLDDHELPDDLYDDDLYDDGYTDSPGDPAP